MRKAFTLIELLIAVIIISILVAILLPTIQMVRDFAKRTRCAHNERQLWTGMMAFTADHNGILLPNQLGNDVTPNWWPAILAEYMEANSEMLDGSQESRYSKKGYNVLADCPDWHPKGQTWNGYYSLNERDGKSLGYAYTQRPTKDVTSGDPGYVNGFQGAVRLARVTYPDLRFAFSESNSDIPQAIPSQTIREGSWTDPEGNGGDIWGKGPRHRGRPNFLLFSGRVVSFSSREQGLWSWCESQGLPEFQKGWLRFNTQMWDWGLRTDSQFWNGIENPSFATY